MCWFKIQQDLLKIWFISYLMPLTGPVQTNIEMLVPSVSTTILVKKNSTECLTTHLLRHNLYPYRVAAVAGNDDHSWTTRAANGSYRLWCKRITWLCSNWEWSWGVELSYGIHLFITPSVVSLWHGLLSVVLNKEDQIGKPLVANNLPNVCVRQLKLLQ